MNATPPDSDVPPKVSAALITYNQEATIGQAIDSILAQETDFDIEIIIGEDCSTDRTRDIVLDYAARHPDRIRLVLSEKNIGSDPQATERPMLRNIKQCRGEYIAFLEGDDYWTDPRKLQTQSDFLDHHPEVALCHHRVAILPEGSASPTRMSRPAPDRVDTRILLHRNPVFTPSVMFRRAAAVPLPEWLHRTEYRDYALLLWISQQGLLAYLPSPMAVYRVHSAGMFSGADPVVRHERALSLLRDIRTRLPEVSERAVAEGLLEQHRWICHALLNRGDRAAARERLRSFLREEGRALRFHPKMIALGLITHVRGAHWFATRMNGPLKRAWRSGSSRSAAGSKP